MNCTIVKLSIPPRIFLFHMFVNFAHTFSFLTKLKYFVLISAGSAFFRPWESVVVGMVSSVIVNESAPLLDKFGIDDPVGAVAVHGVGGALGMIAVGLFVETDPLLNLTGGLSGLFKGGGFYFLLIQLFSCVCTALWSMSTTFILLQVSIKIEIIFCFIYEAVVNCATFLRFLRYDRD